MLWGGLAVAAAGLPWVAWAKGPASLQPVIARAHPQVHWVDVPTLSSWMATGRAVVVDVREAEEYGVSHLPDALLMKPGGKLPKISPAPGQRIVVYCSVGWRSATAAKRLAAVHRTPVYNLTGGIFEWANQGRPLINQDGPAHRVHPYDWAWGQWLEPEARAPLP